MPLFKGTWSLERESRGDAIKSAEFGPREASNPQDFARIVREEVAKQLKVPEKRISVTGIVRA